MNRKPGSPGQTGMRADTGRLRWGDVAGWWRRLGRPRTVVRWAAAIVFVIFGAGKFVNHASELASFRLYDLPAPEVFVYAIGVLELAGGLLLAAGRWVRPVALLLAGDMVGAIVVSGVGRGELVSQTLAPALLVAMLFLLRGGTGAP